MKKYSPPRSTLNVWMPWMRRLTGALGIVNVAAFFLQAHDRVAFVAKSCKLPLLIHSRCRNSIVAIALALMNRKCSPRGISSSRSETRSGRMALRRSCCDG